MKVTKPRNKHITYAITVCNENKELNVLLHTLLSAADENSHILVQGDEGNVSKKVKKVIKKLKPMYIEAEIAFDYIEYPLNGNFSEFKNNLSLHARGEWIFNIDADEIPARKLLVGLTRLLESSADDVDVISFSRINIVNDINVECVDKWRWNISTLDGYENTIALEDVTRGHYDLIKSCGLIIKETDAFVNYRVPIINWPDHQMRLYRNIPNVRWVNKVHEVLVGYRNLAYVTDPEWSLIHLKELDKQINQNIFYENI